MKLIDIIFETVVDMEEAGKPISRNEFIQRSNKIHNGKYTYDNVNYVGSKIPVMITCPKHGDFPVTQNNHLNGVGCKKCYNERNKSNSSDFIKKSQIVHQNPDGTPKYTYDKVDYKDSKQNVTITCPIHGPFNQTPSTHLSGAGCGKCNKGGPLTSNTKDFIKKSQSMSVHQNPDGTPKYTYDKVDYVTADKIVTIICPIHGPFNQTPKDHLRGTGCPRCNESKGEKEIKQILHEKKIKYIPFKKYDDCISHKSKNRTDKRCYKLTFDFYLPDYNTLVEYDGGYHFSGKMYDNQDYVSSVLNDREKNRYTKVNGIKLIRIGYLDMKNIEQELMKGLDSNKQLYLSTNYPIGKGWRDKTIT